jgi:uncharacterized protein
MERSMSENHYLYRLIPPRPTFPMDMSEAEAAVMEAHFGYWAGVIAERKAIAYGPVIDPKGTYGIALVEVADQAAAESLASSDPAIESGAGFMYELHLIEGAMVRD